MKLLIVLLPFFLIGFASESNALTRGGPLPENKKALQSRSVIDVLCNAELAIHETLPPKRAIVVGATSGIGRQVAKELAHEGYDVGLVGRREHLLKSLAEEITTKTYQARIDLSDHERAADELKKLIVLMGGLDLIVISLMSVNDGPCVEREDRPSNWDADFRTINVEAAGFYTAAAVALDFFEKQKSGHLVGISSISGLRGDAGCPVYSAAKAFVSCYLEGMRNKMIQNDLPIDITDVLPGWVDTEQVKYSEMPGTYWVIPAQQAAQDIVDAIKNKEKVRYVAKRQQLVAFALKMCPDWLYNWIGGF